MTLQNSDRILRSFCAGFVFSTAQLGLAKISLAQLFSFIFLSKMNEAGYIEYEECLCMNKIFSFNLNIFLPLVLLLCLAIVFLVVLSGRKVGGEMKGNIVKDEDAAAKLTLITISSSADSSVESAKDKKDIDKKNLTNGSNSCPYKSKEAEDTETEEQEDAPPQPSVIKMDKLPKEFEEQLNAGPQALPSDLEEQLHSLPQELPQDMEQALQIPPRQVTAEEVNSVK